MLTIPYQSSSYRSKPGYKAYHLGCQVPLLKKKSCTASCYWRISNIGRMRMLILYECWILHWRSIVSPDLLAYHHFLIQDATTVSPVSISISASASSTPSATPVSASNPADAKTKRLPIYSSIAGSAGAIPPATAPSPMSISLAALASPPGLGKKAASSFFERMDYAKCGQEGQLARRHWGSQIGWLRCISSCAVILSILWVV